MEITTLIVVGLCVGFVGGLFGVGGGIILIPALHEVLGPDQHLYQSTAMIVNLFVALPALHQHRCAKAIEFRTVARMVPLAVPGVLLGVGVSEMRVFAGEGEAWLRALFGLFLLACATYDVYRLCRRTDGADDSSEARAPMSWSALALVALPTGFASGLLGIGGGILAVPLQRRFLHLPIRTAIANSAAVILPTSLVGAIFKNYAYLSDGDATAAPIRLALVLIPTAVVGSLFGSRLTHRLPVRLVKSSFVLLLLVSGIRLIQAAASSISG